jgi:hypothetical protein
MWEGEEEGLEANMALVLRELHVHQVEVAPTSKLGRSGLGLVFIEEGD